MQQSPEYFQQVAAGGSTWQKNGAEAFLQSGKQLVEETVNSLPPLAYCFCTRRLVAKENANGDARRAASINTTKGVTMKKFAHKRRILFQTHSTRLVQPALLTLFLFLGVCASIYLADVFNLQALWASQQSAKTPRMQINAHIAAILQLGNKVHREAHEREPLACCAVLAALFLYFQQERGLQSLVAERG